jgi:hypothetical protein
MAEMKYKILCSDVIHKYNKFAYVPPFEVSSSDEDKENERNEEDERDEKNKENKENKEDKEDEEDEEDEKDEKDEEDEVKIVYSYIFSSENSKFNFF